MEIREIKELELKELLKLYQQLHNNTMPEMAEELLTLWKRIMEDKDHHIIVGIEESKIVSSCVLVIVPNLTHNQQPYALVENVITDEEYRNKGYATLLLNYARELAKKDNCYKIMLMTGSKKDSTLNFYERAGYNRVDKTAFIQWL